MDRLTADDDELVLGHNICIAFARMTGGKIEWVGGLVAPATHRTKGTGAKVLDRCWRARHGRSGGCGDGLADSADQQRLLNEQ